MIVKIILSFSILFSSVAVLSEDKPVTCELCPGTKCDEA